ncbi:MAG: dolichyl-phosphate beta-D-mannosyltransferase [Ignavibacteria bacterium GWB2_35_12]|nr:MAG: dolichyl-phosphate beta-D-mannosyltransferase [Ignavibacteria bacterium GWB2_35_12]OGU86986.1 MAG: dolichyl-phosphate beta-D-mannosyltransferase [Ignavibacteria bacterium RIFOXYA2_FULL_35_10]OGV24925.1 MAG: dolichyl-phosphate beta-D-mannosyltransferase [Ignavibacteria bacterium RIFOXYC2_FULL_35_21]
MKIIVVIPTYNEIENIENLIASIHSIDESIHVLVVDDNSPDGTSELIKKLSESDNRIHLISRSAKMGLGTAYCEGFAYALKNNFDVIFEMDADFSHDPAMIPIFLEELKNNDLVIGSRYITGVNVVNWPLSRLILSYGANMYSRFITGMPIKDATGGFKCFRADALSKINLSTIKSNGYGFQIEMNYRLWKHGAKIKEIPIIFIDRRSGVSKMNKGIIWEAIFLVWKLRFGFHAHLDKEILH